MWYRNLLLAAFAACTTLPVDGATLWAGSSCSLTTIQAAVDAAEASGDADNTIYLIANQSYSERVQINNLTVTIQGGLADCGSLSVVTGAYSTFEGDGGPDTSLLTITGDDFVVLQNVTLQDAHAVSGIGAGGGINYVGSGTLQLRNVAVILNTAIGGGGINADGEGGDLYVFIDDGTEILNNTATSASGGGVQLLGAAGLRMVEPNTWIALNHAPNGYGGGLSIHSPASAYIGSPGFLGAPAIYSNNAAYGGGIAVTAINDGDGIGTLNLFTTDPQHPIAVSDNIATIAGGGIYLDPRGNELALLQAWNFVIDDNVAPEGSALHLDTHTDSFGIDVGARVELNEGSPPSGSVPCAADVPCNEISRNIAQDSNGQPTLGSTVLVNTSGRFDANALALHGNVANFLFHDIGDNDFDPVEPPGVFLHNCLTGGNNIARELIKMDGDDNRLVLDQCTLAPDIIDSQYAIRFDNTDGNILTISDTIIDEPGTLSLYNPGIEAVFVDYVLTNDDSTLPSQVDVVLGEPVYVDLANGDYHQSATSLGVDFAPAAGGTDLDGNPRDIDLAAPNFFGPRDLGAYEAQQTCSHVDTIYCNGFED